MIILKLIRYLRGYVRFEAKGIFIERFLNLIARARIPIWSGGKREGVYSACVIAGDYKKLRPLAKKSSVHLHITKKRGAPFERLKYRRRTGILVGLAICAGFIIFMSQFIWRVEVNGNESISEAQIRQALEELRIEPGRWKASIDVREMERKIILLIPDLSWAALNIKGSAAHVEVSERAKPPKVIDPKSPCNVVAREAGQILSMNVFDGQKLVSVGDTVLPGDIIVSGVTQDQFRQSLFRHARAEVMARVQTQIKIEIPMDDILYEETGKTTIRRHLVIFEHEIPVFLPFKIPAPYHIEQTNSPLILLGAELPIAMLRENYILMREIPVTYTEEEALKIAISRLKIAEKAKFKDAEILDRQLTAKLNGKILELTAMYTCDMDIAVEKEIAIPRQ